MLTFIKGLVININQLVQLNGIICLMLLQLVVTYVALRHGVSAWCFDMYTISSLFEITSINLLIDHQPKYHRKVNDRFCRGTAEQCPAFLTPHNNF